MGLGVKKQTNKNMNKSILGIVSSDLHLPSLSPVPSPKHRLPTDLHPNNLHMLQEKKKNQPRCNFKCDPCLIDVSVLLNNAWPSSGEDSAAIICVRAYGGGG